MRNKITYELRLGPQYDMFGLARSSPDRPLMVADNKSSDFSLSRILPNESGGHIKEIKGVSSSPRKTRIVTNTSSVRLTNVFADDGIPLFFKTRLRHFNKVDIVVNGQPAQSIDSHFIYTNDTEVLIEYFSKEGGLLLSTIQEVYPVFIWENQVNLLDIIALDNKKFYYRESKGNVVITASKPNVVVEVDPEPVFTVKRIRDKVVAIDPFLFADLRSNESGRLSFEYDYLTVVPNIVSRLSEQLILKNNDYMTVSNINIFKESVVMYKIVDGERVVIIDNADGSSNNIIDSSLGRIYAINLIEDGIIKFGDIIYLDYRYLATNTTLKIDNEDIPLRDVKVHFRIRPTRIRKPGVNLSFQPSLSYIITDMADNILLSNDDDIPDYEFYLPIHLGFGKGAYGDMGYSGVRDDYSLIIIEGDGSTPIGSGGSSIVDTETGYGERGYSDGPYGGSYLKKITDVENLLDIKNNSEAGTITISALEFSPSIKSAQIFPYLNTANSKYGNGKREQFSYANILWNTSLSGDDEDIIDTSSTTTINSYSTIDFNPSILFHDEIKMILGFDISGMADGITLGASIKDEYILTGMIDAEALGEVDLYSATIPSSPNSLLNLVSYKYSDGEYEVLPYDIYISSDMKQATIILSGLDLQNLPINIGLGYSDGDLEIYPTRTLIL